MSKILWKIIFSLIMMIVVLNSGIAKADSLDEVQITCSEDLNYFSLRTLQVEYRGYPKGEQEKRLESKSSLYTVKSLLEHPYTCNMKDIPVSVEVVNFVPAKATGECGGMGHFDLLIKEYGSEAYTFSPYGFCTDRQTHLIEILPPITLRDCIIPDGPGQMTCSYPGR